MVVTCKGIQDGCLKYSRIYSFLSMYDYFFNLKIVRDKLEYKIYSNT